MGLRAVLLCLICSGLIGSSPRAAETLTFTHQNVVRTAVLHRPPATVGQPAPLVIALHGTGGTGEWLRAYTGLDAVSDREKFVAVFPDAVNRAWSYGRPINQPMPTVGGAIVDDVGFIRLLIRDLVDRKIAEPKRIYVAGMSRGALMAYTLACALADDIAAVASMIAGMTEYQREDCKPSRPVPIMLIGGTKDPEMAFDGGKGLVGALLSVRDTMEFWRERHGCTQRDAQRLPHRDAADKTRVSVVEWTGCRGEARLRLYEIEGGGHQLPSLSASASGMSEERFGPRNHDFETAEELWSFFRGYAMP